MTEKQAVKMLKTEKEIVCLNPASQAVFSALALNLLYRGVSVKAKLVQGWGKS